METITLARDAMNTRFELVLHGTNTPLLRAAGEEALAEIGRIENRLSLFRPSTEIARVNAFAATEPVLVSPEVFALLQRAQRLSAETDGAFDITMAPLLRCWGLLGRNEGRVPGADELAAARDIVGMKLVELDAANRTVRFARPGVMIDLGAIGKGYAIEQATEILREAGVTSALLHGGTSSVMAIGAPPDAEAWKVVIDRAVTAPKAFGVSPLHLIPREAGADIVGQASRLSGGGHECESGHLTEGGSHRTGGTPVPLLLRDESLSVSAVRAKSFVAEGRTLGHVIDPRTGEPTNGALRAAVVLPSATEGDAFSTALLVLGAEGRERIEGLRPGMRTWLEP